MLQMRHGLNHRNIPKLHQKHTFWKNSEHPVIVGSQNIHFSWHQRHTKPFGHFRKLQRWVFGGHLRDFGGLVTDWFICLQFHCSQESRILVWGSGRGWMCFMWLVGIIAKMWLAGDVSKLRLGGMPIRMFGILAIWKKEVGRGEILTNFCSQSGRLMILSTAQGCVAGCDRYMVVVTALAKLISKLKTLLVNDWHTISKMPHQ